MLSPTELAVIASSLASLLALALSIWAKLTARSNEDIRELREHDGDVHARLARIEAALDNVLPAEAVHKIEVDVARMEGAINVIGERLKPVVQVTERLQEWLLDQGK